MDVLVNISRPMLLLWEKFVNSSPDLFMMNVSALGRCHWWLGYYPISKGCPLWCFFPACQEYRVTHEAPHVSLDNNTDTSKGDRNQSPQFRHLCPVSSHLEAPSKVTLENPLSFLFSTRRTLGEEPEEREKVELVVAVLPVWKWCWGSTGSWPNGGPHTSAQNEAENWQGNPLSRAWGLPSLPSISTSDPESNLMKLLRMESLLASTSQKKKQRLRVGRWMFQDTSWHLEEWIQSSMSGACSGFSLCPLKEKQRALLLSSCHFKSILFPPMDS